MASRIAPRVGEAIRDEFPILAHTTYVNSCSQGALSHRVRSAYREYLEGWDANGAEWEHWVERAETMRASFAHTSWRPHSKNTPRDAVREMAGAEHRQPDRRGG